MSTSTQKVTPRWRARGGRLETAGHRSEYHRIGRRAEGQVIAHRSVRGSWVPQNTEPTLYPLRWFTRVTGADPPDEYTHPTAQEDFAAVSSLDAFLLSREAMGCTPKTLEHYRYTAGGFVDWLGGQGVTDVRYISSTHIREYLVSLRRRGLKDTTQHAHARGIKTFLNWLVGEDLLVTSPIRNVPMPRLEKRIPAPYSHDEIRRLLEACDPETPTGARNRAMVLVFLDSGLRLSELAGLSVGDINPQTGLTTVLGKGRKQRRVRVGRGARAAIEAMLAQGGHPPRGAPLWAVPGRGGASERRLTPSGIQSMLVRLGRRANVHPCGAHRFRRTFALWCLRDGMDLHTLRLFMGHEGLAVLQRYLALDGQDVERAHREHSPVDCLLRASPNPGSTAVEGKSSWA